MDLKCPYRESSKYLCDRQPAVYSIDSVIYCLFHARLLMSRREMTRRDTPYFDADEMMALIAFDASNKGEE